MKKVLIVEDNELNMKLFRDLLTNKGFKVDVSKDGKDIVNSTIDFQPDLILMDVQLGIVSGIDLIRELKSTEATKHIPIIAITAFAMKQDEAKILTSGCDLFLPKPVSVDVFFEAVNELTCNTITI